MTKKKQLINQIKNFENKYFNEDQKTIAISILERAPEEEVQAIADFIFMKRRTGFGFDYSPEIAKGRLIILREDKKRRINIGDRVEDNENKLIIGDNYDALKSLLVTHKNKVDVIYIDPPYNTESAKFDGNQSSKDGKSNKFLYKDKFGRGGWLNMMYSRLLIARELLSKTGSIFVSIDDNEQAYLKIIMDEIFKEENFISCIVLEITKTQGMKVRTAKNGSVAKNHEYILFYSYRDKPVNNILYDFVDYYDKNYDLFLKKIEGNRMHFIPLKEHIAKAKDWKVFFDKYNKKISVDEINNICLIDEDFKNLVHNNSEKIFRQTMVGMPDSKVLKIINATKGNKYIGYKLQKYIYYLNSQNKPQQYLSLDKSLKKSDDYKSIYGRCTIRGTMWKNFYSDMMHVEKEGYVKFKNGKKPKRLIRQLVSWVSNKDSIILDFFAGSGTTAHAVLDLNSMDSRNRKFILCTNNENDIASKITYERIHALLKGKNFKYKTDFIPKESLYPESNLRVVNIDNTKVIELTTNIEPKIYEECMEGLILLDPKYNKKDLNLYYDLAALNPLKNKKDRL